LGPSDDHHGGSDRGNGGYELPLHPALWGGKMESGRLLAESPKSLLD